jgi:chromosome segregation ATPase
MKGFVKLSEKYAQSTARISTLEEELGARRGESEQLKGQIATLQEARAQIATLQENLRVQTETTANEVESVK